MSITNIYGRSGMTIMKSIGKLFDVIYCHLYIAYSRVEYLTPEYSVVLTMASTIAFIYFGVQEFISHQLKINGVSFISMLLPILIVAFIAERLFNRRYVKSNRYKKLRREKPVIVNRTVSIIITILYSVLGAVILIGSGLIYGNN